MNYIDNVLKKYIHSNIFSKYLDNGCKNRPGPYLICKVILYFFVLGVIINIINLITTITKFNIQLYITLIILILTNILWIYFIYNMCYLCRGWVAFFIYIFLMFLWGILMKSQFNSINKKSIYIKQNNKKVY